MLPKMKRFYGTPQAKVDSGLDDRIYNEKMAEKREKRRE